MNDNFFMLCMFQSDGLIDAPKLKNIKDEAKELKELLSKQKKRYKSNENFTFDYEVFENITHEKLTEELKDYKEEITHFHYSGHHDNGLFSGAHYGWLFDILKECKKLKFILLNGCNTNLNLQELNMKIPVLIHSNFPIYDFWAYKFSIYFYTELFELHKGDGMNIEILPNYITANFSGSLKLAQSHILAESQEVNFETFKQNKRGPGSSRINNNVQDIYAFGGYLKIDLPFFDLIEYRKLLKEELNLSKPLLKDYYFDLFSEQISIIETCYDGEGDLFQFGVKTKKSVQKLYENYCLFIRIIVLNLYLETNLLLKSAANLRQSLLIDGGVFSTNDFKLMDSLILVLLNSKQNISGKATKIIKEFSSGWEKTQKCYEQIKNENSLESIGICLKHFIDNIKEIRQTELVDIKYVNIEKYKSRVEFFATFRTGGRLRIPVTDHNTGLIDRDTFPDIAIIFRGIDHNVDKSYSNFCPFVIPNFFGSQGNATTHKDNFFYFHSLTQGRKLRFINSLDFSYSELDNNYQSESHETDNDVYPSIDLSITRDEITKLYPKHYEYFLEITEVLNILNF